ncbi:aldo/keto reductase [Mobilitalea sibirica]|uniref:Aldo/keto reductase n=1 Tax=Mobilitalea sibirica TaxID=1462919 RepID=A0A8J7KTV8_9FIRM|nr:aldo/keto reductase [Mobilitalea sibirica]MBH1941796.1 aldo/keto reductase [Mobilitalea sibirica]
MQYIDFGKSNRQISRFGMGCMRFPRTKAEDGSEIIDEKEAIKMIRYAIDHGVNYMDTAYSYPGSEVVLGKALKDGYREKVMIETKSPSWAINCPEDFQKFFDEEIERLQVDYIDTYLFHCLDRSNWEKVKKNGGFEFMEKLKKEGKIKNIGFSFHADYELFTEIVDAYSWDTCLIQLNILDQNHQAGLKGLKYAADRGISVVIMEPLKGGMIGTKVPEEVDQLLDNYDDKRSLVEWAFRWLYHYKEAKVILSGVSNMQQLEDNLRIFSKAESGVMSEKDMELITGIQDIYRRKVKVGCTGCGYCMPCPSDVNIPEIFKIYNDSQLTDWSEFGKTFYHLIASTSGKDASNCTACRLCESHCPQNIQIADVLKEAHLAFTQS